MSTGKRCQPSRKGIRRRATDWELFAKVRGRYVSERYPLDTPEAALLGLREHMIAVAKHGAPALDTPEGRTFEQDATAYLALVTHMPSYQDRKYQIGEWVKAFRGRMRATITAIEIAAQLQKWRGRGEWADGTLNRRRTALMHLYTRLDGRSAPNVVKDVPPYSEVYSEQDRAIDMLTALKVIRRMSWKGKSRARCRALLWTGLPTKLFQQIREKDLVLVHGDDASVWVAARRKGSGIPAARIPLMPRLGPNGRPRYPAVNAFRRLIALGGLGAYSGSSLHSRVAEAVARENAIRRAKGQPPVPPIHPYMFRHSFGTWLAPQVRDDRVLAQLLRTESIARYTVASVSVRLREVAKQLAKGWQPAHLAKKTRELV